MSDRSSHPMHALSAVGLLTIFMTLLGWSSVPLFLKHFSHLMDPWTANGWRYGFSALVWLPVIITGLFRKNLPAGIWRAAIVPSIFNVLGQVAFAWAPYFIDPGLMTFGLRTQILFVAGGAYMLFPAERKVLKSPVFLGALATVFLGAMGTLVLARMRAAGVETTSVERELPQLLGYTLTKTQATAVGGALAVGSGILFAGYALAVRHFMHGMPPVKAFAAICQYTGAGLFLLMLPMADKQLGLYVFDLSGRELATLALSAIIGIALGHVFYYISIARLGVAVSSGVIQLQPIIVGIASYFIFGEILSVGQWACGSLAVVGAMTMLATQHVLGKRERERSQPACTSCGYSRAGLAAEMVCPECGEMVGAEAR